MVPILGGGSYIRGVVPILDHIRGVVPIGGSAVYPIILALRNQLLYSAEHWQTSEGGVD